MCRCSERNARPKPGSRWHLGLWSSGTILISDILSLLCLRAFALTFGSAESCLPPDVHRAHSFIPFQGLCECLPFRGPPYPLDLSDLPVLLRSCFPCGALFFFLVWASCLISIYWLPAFPIRLFSGKSAEHNGQGTLEAAWPGSLLAVWPGSCHWHSVCWFVHL